MAIGIGGLLGSAASIGNVLKIGLGFDIKEVLSGEKKLLESFDNIKVNGLLALGAVGVAFQQFTAAVLASTKELVQFESQMARVHVLMNDFAGPTLGKVTEQVRTFAREHARSLTEVAQVAEDIYSVNLGSQLEDFLHHSDVLAKSIGVSQVDAVNLLVGATNAYKDEVLSLMEISDTLTTIIDDGAISGQELAHAFGHIIGAAVGAGVALDEWGSALSAMTVLMGGNAQIAATNLRQMITQLTNETRTAGKAFKEATGESFKEWLANDRGLLEGLLEIFRYINEQGTTIEATFGRFQSASGTALLTATQGAAIFSQTLENVENNIGKAEVNARKVEDTIGYRWDVAFSKAKGSFESVVGDFMIPMLNRLLDIIELVQRHWDNIANGLKRIFGPPQWLEEWLKSGDWDASISNAWDAQKALFALGEEYADLQKKLEDAKSEATRDKIVEQMYDITQRSEELRSEWEKLDTVEYAIGLDEYVKRMESVHFQTWRSAEATKFYRDKMEETTSSQEIQNIRLHETARMHEEARQGAEAYRLELEKEEQALRDVNEQLKEHYKSLASVNTMHIWRQRGWQGPIPLPVPYPGDFEISPEGPSTSISSTSSSSRISTPSTVVKKTPAQLREERRQQSIPGMVSAWHALVQQFFSDDRNVSSSWDDFVKFAKGEWSADYQISRAQSDVAGKWTPYGLQQSGRGVDFFGGGIGQAVLPVFNAAQQTAIDRVNAETRQRQEAARRAADEDFRRVKQEEDEKRAKAAQEKIDLERAMRETRLQRTREAAEAIWGEFSNVMDVDQEGINKVYAPRFWEAHGEAIARKLGVLDILQYVKSAFMDIAEDTHEWAALRNTIALDYNQLDGTQRRDSLRGFLGATGFGGFGVPTSLLSLVGGVANRVTSDLACDIAAQQEMTNKLLAIANKQRRELSRGSVTVNTVGVGHELVRDIEMAEKARAATI